MFFDGRRGVVFVIAGLFLVIFFVTLLRGEYRITSIRGNDARQHSIQVNRTYQTDLRIAACTTVKDDVPYITEWVEFYRLQGFTKFWIFDDRSTDKVHLLQALYNFKFPGKNIVEVHKHETPGYQPHAYSKCHAWALEQGFDWVGVMDTDEFWYSPTYQSVSEYLDLEVSDPMIGVIHVSQFRFGTNGQKDRFQYALDLNEDKEPFLNNPRGVELITKNHVLRGPYKRFGEPAELIDHSYPNCSIPAKDGWMMCHTDIRDSKSLWRPTAVSNINVHSPDYTKSGFTRIEPDPLILRGNHYYYRSIADCEKKAKDWNKPDPLEGVQRVDSYWNSVQDLGIQRFTRQLELSMDYLILFHIKVKAPPDAA